MSEAEVRECFELALAKLITMNARRATLASIEAKLLADMQARPVS